MCEYTCLCIYRGSLWLRWWRICMQCRGPGFDPWVGKIPWRRVWLPTSRILAGEFHAQRSLAGYSPWGHKEADMTEQLTHTPTRMYYCCCWITQLSQTLCHPIDCSMPGFPVLHYLLEFAQIIYVFYLLIYNVVIVSGVQQSDSVMCMFFQVLFPYRLL